jgi:aquaporin Z
MAMILGAVYTHKEGFGGFSGVAIGGMKGRLNILFLPSTPGASMNSAVSLAQALLSGAVQNLWLYRTATFAGSMATVARKKFA